MLINLESVGEQIMFWGNNHLEKARNQQHNSFVSIY